MSREGDQLGPYLLISRIGQGAFGEVWLAEKKTPIATMRVALKMPYHRDVDLEVFKREAGIWIQASGHPNVLPLIDANIYNERVFIVTEYAPDGSLENWLKLHGGKAPSLEDAIQMMLGILAGLEHLHTRHIIHRDLKPSNILLQGNVPRLTDFGISRLFTTTTISMEISGTPMYMPPEAFDGRRSLQTDIWAAGVILYQMLSGQLPFPQKDMSSLMAALLTHQPSPLPSTMPAGLREVVAKSLSKDANERYQSASHMAMALKDAFFSISSTLAMASKSNVRLETLQDFTGLEEVTQGDLSENLPADLINNLIPSESEIRLTENLTIHMRSSGSPSDWEPLASSTVELRRSEILRRKEEHVFEELILHKDYERLWRALMYAGSGKYLLTGYGPFGGTSLLRCAIAKARNELHKIGRNDGALLIFYFQVADETKENYKIEASKFGFGHIRGSSKDNKNPDLQDLKARARVQQGKSEVIAFSLAKPIGSTFFRQSSDKETIAFESSPLDNPRNLRKLDSGDTASLTSRIIQFFKNRTHSIVRRDRLVKESDYDFSKLVFELNDFFKKRQSNLELRNIVLRLVKSEFLPSRVVIIIDKVRFLETLDKLSKSELFSNEQIMIIAVARKEDFDLWRDSYQRLRKLDFAKWYVPCLWNVDELGQKLFTNISSGSKSHYKLLLKHLEYKGRGSLGNIVAELSQPTVTHYGRDSNFIDVSSLVNRAEIQHNAWLQGLLDVTWSIILGDMFGGPKQDELTDRARLGIYEILDWITEKVRFTKQELMATCGNFSITIADDEVIATKTIEHLLQVLTENHYLQIQNNNYRVIWNKSRPAKYRTIKLTDQIAKTNVRKRLKTQERRKKPKAKVVKQSEPISTQSDLQKAEGAASIETAFDTINEKSLPLLEKESNENSKREDKQIAEGPPFTKTSVIGSRDIASHDSKRIVKTITEIRKTEFLTQKESETDQTINILVVFANPKGSVPLRLEEEDRTIRDCIKRSKNRAFLNERIIHAARIMDFQRELLENNYQIVQFSGHGTPSGHLAFEDETGKVKLVPQEVMAKLLSAFPSVECVILNACYSLNKGHFIAMGVPYTIAMDGPISDDAAKHFIRGFYDALGAGRNYSFSYQMGCVAISLEGYSEENNPQLLEKPTNLI